MERFNRQLKASLKTKGEPQRWTETLPLVLVGIRTVIKQDLGCSTAELVFGTTLRLTGQFVAPDTDSSLEPGDYVHRLRRTMLQVKPHKRIQWIHRDLSSCTHVFVRCDHVQKPLQPPYKGPYRVLERRDKFYILDLNGKRDTVSLDRLKIAYLDTDLMIPTIEPTNHPTTTPHPPATTPTTVLDKATTLTDQIKTQQQTTRSSRHVHWPTRYTQFHCGVKCSCKIIVHFLPAVL